jgi:hypothetical protein
MPCAATGRRYPLLVQLIRQCPVRHEALHLQLANGREQSRARGGLLAHCPAAYTSPAGRSFPVKLHRAIMAALLAAALFQSEHQQPHKAPMSAPAPDEREQAHGAIQNRKSVSICASNRPPRWRDARHARNGIGPGWPRNPTSQVGIWRIAGNRDRSGAGWTDTVANSARSREGRPMRRNPTAVSGVWLFLLSSVLRRNGLLSLHLWSRRKPPAGQR